MVDAHEHIILNVMKQAEPHSTALHNHVYKVKLKAKLTEDNEASLITTDPDSHFLPLKAF